MSCRSCDLKRIYKLFEEKKRKELEIQKENEERTKESNAGKNQKQEND